MNKTDKRIQEIREAVWNITNQCIDPNTTVEKLNSLIKQNNRLKEEVDNMINELQVEHFLTNGPGGQDPV